MTSTLPAVIDPAFDNAERALAEAESLADVINVRDQAEAIRVLMARQKRSLEWQNRAAEIKLRAERKAGELLAQVPRDKGGRPAENSPHREASFTGYQSAIRDAGIPKATAERWQQVAAIPEPVFEDHIAHTKQAESELTTAGLIRAQKLAPMMSSASPEWYTPDHIIERVFAVLEDIDLDPCADPDLSIAAGQHFTAETDGLAHEWRGRVYMNPPYGDGIGVWVRKLITEFEVGNTTEAIALVPARIDTQWWKPLASRFVWCGIEGRLRFSGSQDSAPFPSALFYLGGRPERFAREFADLGLVYDRFGR